jgi:hypothetical protein
MADNDNTKGGGRGTGRGINRGRKGWSSTTLSQSNIGKTLNASKAHIATNTLLHPTHLSSKRDKGATTLSQSNIGKPINPSKAHIATNTQLHPTHLSSFIFYLIFFIDLIHVLSLDARLQKLLNASLKGLGQLMER